MRKDLTAGAVIKNSKGEVAIVDQGDGTYTLPKGKCKKGEKLLDTAIREIYEEVGLTKLQLIKKLGTYKRYEMKEGGGENVNVLKIIHIFLFKTDEEILAPQEGDIKAGLWVEKKAVTRYLTHPKDREFFESIKDEF